VVARLVLELPRRAGGFRPVRRPIKALIITLIVLIALPLVAWTGTFLYWHFRINAALRDLERQHETRTVTGSGQNLIVVPDPILGKAGCRALPYLVRDIGSAEEQSHFRDLMSFVLILLADSPFKDEEDRNNFRTFATEFGLPRTEEWKSMRAAFQKEWSEGKLPPHQWWRVWSSSCAGVK
jgi:hypothetical protein